MSLLPNKIADIQVLRGLAVSAVFIQHYASWFPLVAEGSSVQLNFFWIGVDLFFVISGFLIVTKLLSYDRCDPWPVFKNFWSARFWRLMPAAAFWALISGAVTLCIGWIDQRSVLQVTSATIASLTGASNVYWWACFSDQISQMLCAGRGPFGVYWSLSLEEQFYLVASILLLLGFRKSFLTFLIAACAWNLTTEWMSPWSFGWVFRPYGLALGSALAFLYWKWPVLLDKKLAVHDRVALAVVLMLLTVFMAIFYHPITTLVASLLCGALLWIALMDNCLSRTPFGRALEYLGERSYSFYLCHVIVIIIVRDLVIRTTGGDGAQWLMQSWWLCALTFGLALAVSHFSYSHIETRFRQVTSYQTIASIKN